MNKSNILLYHGVTEDKFPFGIENCSGKHMDSDLFEEQMKYISENKNVCSLRDLVTMLQEKYPCPPDCVAVTFDDSFKNVRTVALPILEKYNIPATFFITTGMVSNDRMFWVDHLEHMLNKTRLESFYFRGTYYPICYLKYKVETLSKLKKEMKSLPPKERGEMLEELMSILGWEDHRKVDNYKNLTWEDVIALDQSPTCEVGGHTISHEILSLLSPAEMRYEIKACLSVLSDRLGRKVSLFSYPEGQETHYNDDVISVLKEHGVEICPSAVDGVNYDNEDPFHLKRNMVGFVGGKFPFEEESNWDHPSQKIFYATT